MTAKKHVFKPASPSIKRRSKGLKTTLKALSENTGRAIAQKRDQLRSGLEKHATEVVRTMGTAVVSSSSTLVDPDDAPEWTEEQFERADLYHGDKLVRRGRPSSAHPKKALKLRIDADVVEHFRATGPGWQTRINDTLRRAAKLPARKYEPIEQ
jgi:uncharacterized protein (DUF4415 family)